MSIVSAEMVEGTVPIRPGVSGKALHHQDDKSQAIVVRTASGVQLVPLPLLLMEPASGISIKGTESLLMAGHRQVRAVCK